MLNRAQTITHEVQKYDRELYCTVIQDVLAVCRKTYKAEHYEIAPNEHLTYLRESPHLVFPLTDTWSMNGKPVDWGLEPIMAKIRAADLWKRNVAEDLIASYEAKNETQRKDVRNQTEDFLYENHAKFKRAFADINTSSLAKKDRRYLDDKKIKGV